MFDGFCVCVCASIFGELEQSQKDAEMVVKPSKSNPKVVIKLCLFASFWGKTR